MMGTRKPDLASDQRGAIMVIGLGSALLLVGALWFLMGVADTILWRDRMQEAVDAAAFSSATIHARGMNFVAAINLVMLALVTIHLVLGLVADVLTVIAAICLIPPLDPAAPEVYEAALSVREAQQGYDVFMWIALHTMNAAQTATALAAPQLGTLAAMEVGSEYDASVIAIGPSNIPTPLPPLGVDAPDGLGGAGGGRLGLPVAFEPYSAMCKRPVAWILEYVLESFRRFPIFSSVLAKGSLALSILGPFAPAAIAKFNGWVNKIFSAVSGLFGKGLEALECNSLSGSNEQELFDKLADAKVGKVDKIKPAFALLKQILPGAIFPLGADPDRQWGWPGSKKIWGSSITTKNGSNWMQVWAWTRDESKVDDHERKVGIARRKYGDIERDKQVQGSYIAQAEFYYDCGSPTAKWGDFACNGAITDSNFTMYSMHWVARLKRVRHASLSGFIFDTAINIADGFDFIKKLLVKIPGIGDGKNANVKAGVLDMQKILRAVIDKVLITPIVKWLGYPDPDAEIIH